MKNYTAPKIRVNIFDNSAQTVDISGTPEAPQYIEGLEGIAESNRAMVNIENGVNLTKFIF